MTSVITVVVVPTAPCKCLYLPSTVNIKCFIMCSSILVLAVASMLPLPGDIPLPQAIHRPHGILKKSSYLFEKYVLGFIPQLFAFLH